MSQLRTTLSNPNLRRLFAAQVPADFADWLDYVAIAALLAFRWDAPPVAFAVFAVCLGLPYLIVGPFAGVIVDRVQVKHVLIASNVGRALVTLMLAFATTWPVLMAFVLLRSSVDAFYSPAKQTAIQALTPTEGLMSANGLSHAINQSSKIVAPMLGGALLLVLIPQQVFLLNTLTSLLAAALMWRLAPVPRIAAEEKHTMFASIRQGFITVRDSVPLRSALLVMAAGYFALFFYDTLIAPLARELGFSETMFGLTMAAVGIGSIVGSLVLIMSKDTARPFLVIGAGAAIGGIGVVMLGVFEIGSLVMAATLYLGVFVVLGFSSTMIVIPVRTIIQRETDPSQIGRVTALSEATNTIALLTSPFIGAAIASILSVGFAFVVGGVIMLGIAVYAVRKNKR